MIDIFGNLTEILAKQIEASNKAFDNLFNADHRNMMISKYGYTEAMRITIEDLERGKA